MGKVIMSGIVPKLTYEAPINGILLSDIAEGSIVYINESGTETPFYVAKHNYESGLNGNGKTLLLRQKCVTNKKWGSYMGWLDAIGDTSGTPYYLENTYKATLPSAVQALLGTLIYVSNNNKWTLTTCSAKVFTPSLAEYQWSYNDTLAEGSALPEAPSMRIAYRDIASAKVKHWTRTGKVIEGDDGECEQTVITTSGDASTLDVNSTYGYVRPCFTLPATTLFDEDTLTFKGVS